MNCFYLPNPFYTAQRIWLIRAEGSIIDTISENWYEQISSVSGQSQLFFPATA